MKTNQTIRKIKNYSKIPVLAMAVLLTGCEKEDDPVDPVNAGNDVPSEEHDHEVITDVELIFTNDADPSDVVIASAVDPDGEGIEELTIEDAINLDAGKTYTLTFGIWNKLEHDHDDHDDHDDHGDHDDHDDEGDHDDHDDEGDHDDHDDEGDHDDHDDEGENVAEEIEDEDDEHQFFFSFTEGAFSDPAGNGNIDNASDAINYIDKDANGNNVGLSTSWTTSADAKTGKFKVVLMHQPSVKTATSGVNDGDADFELEFDLIIE